MILRLCLRIGLISPWASLAWSNEASRCSINVYRFVFLPQCEISVHIRGTQSIQDMSLSISRTEQIHPLHERMQLQHDSDDRIASPADPDPNSAVNPTPAFRELERAVRKDTIFRLGEKEYLDCIHKAFVVEIDYLKNAYVASAKSAPKTGSPSPSLILFGKQYGEVDRTLTGVNALRWIYRNDYDSYTRNQPVENKLRPKIFQQMRRLFRRYAETQDILTLMMMQITNDLGKSPELKDLYTQGQSQDNIHQVNHDMMMYHIVRDQPQLVPSFLNLPSQEQALVSQLLHISAEFNPAQLVQAECPPEVMLILQEQAWATKEANKALDRKFLELLLDLSGALGHISHEGAKTMTEPVVQSFLHALKISKEVASKKLTPKEAYYRVIDHRLSLLEQVGWQNTLQIRTNHQDFTNARLFCMGRVDSVAKATLFESVVNDLPAQVQEDLQWGLRIDHKLARQATYMPGMIANCSTHAQLTTLLKYLARVLVIRTSDLDTLSDPSGIVIVERDVFWTIGDIVKTQAFKDDPEGHINESTPLPELQVLKRSAKVACQGEGQLLGDEYYHMHG